ncbi:MAG: DAK2 domain-containing protein [Firmicutes bacterium]|nr:DAK2 domain-containing protein [Bacillota bacterium]
MTIKNEREMFDIEKLDGIKFSQMMISGANKLYNNRQRINDLNVFPVPDGDTGTNMSMTAAAVADALGQGEIPSAGRAAECMAYTALRGARGNSGVILSQLFRGMAKSIKGKDEITPRELAASLDEGAKAAYRAVMTPTEGTILTVAREAAQGAVKAAETAKSAEEVIDGAVKRGNESLKMTLQMLPALREAGVVDAGGAGCMLILEGALEYLKTGEAVKSDAPEQNAPKTSAAGAKAAADIKFQYCTEFIAEKSKNGADVEALRETIKNEGDCMLVIDDEEVVKVHIHTNHPGLVIEEALKIGEIISLKVDNMKRQHSELISEAPRAAKKSERIKEFGFAAVASGHGMANILTDLGVDRVIEGGQSMNPGTQDILKAVSKIKAKTVYVFPNNKNIVMAAKQAAQLAEDKRVTVIETVSVPQCVRAMTEFNVRRSAEENEKRMISAAKSVKTGQITYAVKNAEIAGKPVKKGDILGIDGGEIRYIGGSVNRVLEKMISSYTGGGAEYITVYVGKDVKRRDIENTAKRITENCGDAEVSFKRGGQPIYYYTVSAE